MNNSTSDYFIGLSNKLAEDYKIVVITSKIRETNIKLHNDITVLKWPSKRPNSWSDFLFLLKLVRFHKPILMISMFSSVNLFLIIGWLFRVKSRVAWIRTLSTQYAQRKFKVWRKSIIYALATDIITNSKATKFDVITFYKIPENKITVLPNSVKDYNNSLGEIVFSKNNFLYVGRLHPSKGVDILIHAFSQILKEFSNLHLDVIGQGKQKVELVELAEKLKISSNISFLGEKDKTTVLKAFKKSYCTIIPSYSEAFGFTVIEAMSVGTCVLGANNTGIKEIILSHKTGLMFETGNCNDLVKHLKRLILDEDFRNELAEAGYKRFLQFYETNYAIDRDAVFLTKNL